MHALDQVCPNSVLFAPMVGLSHAAVRASLGSFLPPGRRTLWPSEMLNSRRVPAQKENQNPELCFKDIGLGIGPQLLGNEEGPIRESIQHLESFGCIAIDINMGCPVSKALKHNYGVALMGDPQYAQQVTRYAVQSAKVPVSVKLRAGFDKDQENLLPFIEGVFNAGASWVTLHPRTAEQKRRGNANWNLILKAVDQIKRPIIGNGDVQCLEDIERMLNETRCSRVMIGRALLMKPWLLNYDGLGSQEPPPEDQSAIVHRHLIQIIQNCFAWYETAAAFRKLKFFIVYAKPWIEFGEVLHGEFQRSQSQDEMIDRVNRFFLTPKRIWQRTELRA